MVYRESGNRLQQRHRDECRGQSVDDGKIGVDPHNAQELHVALQPLAPVVYEVHWHRLSADKHRTQGQFSFIVASD